MTSEERALNLMEWFNTDDEEYIATLDTIKDMFDQHAVEARADQAEKCGNATKSAFELYGPLITFPIVMQACLNAVEKEDVK